MLLTEFCEWQQQSYHGSHSYNPFEQEECIQRLQLQWFHMQVHKSCKLVKFGALYQYGISPILLF